MLEYAYMREIRRLLVEIRPLYGYLAVVLVFALVRTGVGLLDPWVYREVINYLTYRELSQIFQNILPATTEVGTLMYLVLIFLGTDVFRSVWYNLSTYYSVFFTTRSRDIISKRVLKKLHSLSVGYFENTKPGLLQERIMMGTRAVTSLSQEILVDIIPVIFQLAVGIVVLAYFDIWLSVGLMIATPLYVGLSYWRTKLAKKTEELVRDAMEERHATYVENINYQQLIKEYGREKFEQKRFDVIAKNAFTLQLRQQKMLRTFWILQELIIDGAYAWAMGYGGYLVITGSMQIGDVVLVASYLNNVIHRVSVIMSILESIQIDFISARRLFDLFDHKDAVEDLDNAVNLKLVKGEVEFQNVSFAYEGGEEIRGRKVFNNFNLKIKAGETVALVGPSGVGKSTLIKLLLRFYDPDKGTVLVDGKDIRTITQTSLRHNIATIMQDVLVLNERIRYNIGYGKPTAGMAAIVKASKTANLFEFINSLKDKFNTRVGERGVKLSGGERQRLGIARAMLKDAPILIMDEATSALDSVNENKIQQAMWRLIKGRTTIIIAHRLSTVKKADKIVVLNGGKIVEQGTHKELLKKGGYYKKLYSMQGVLLKD